MSILRPSESIPDGAAATLDDNPFYEEPGDDPFDPEMMDCPTCHGTGVYEHNPCDDHYIERLACSECDGTGRVPIIELSEETMDALERWGIENTPEGSPFDEPQEPTP